MSVHLGITQLHAAYADIASRREWSEMATIVRPDARFTFELPAGAGGPVELVGPDALAEFGHAATAAFDFYSYQPLNAVVVEDGGDVATGRFYALEVATLSSTGQWLEFYGGYDDEYVLLDGRWWFARRQFRVLATRS